VTAIEAYKLEYGAYPAMFDDGPINLSEGQNAERFVMTLMGRDLSGERLSAELRKQFNRKAIPFYHFGEQELGERDNLGNLRIVDAYGNDQIVIHVDHDEDGYVTIPIDGKMTPVQGRAIIYTIAQEDMPAVSTYD